MGKASDFSKSHVITVGLQKNATFFKSVKFYFENLFNSLFNDSTLNVKETEYIYVYKANQTYHSYNVCTETFTRILDL